MRLIAAIALFVVALLRRRAFAYDPAGRLEVSVEGDAAGRPAGETLEILSWNVGYGALGGDLDFLADGGRHLRPRSRAAVERNLGAITRLLATASDTVLLQEVSRAAWITHRVDVLDHVAKTLAGHARAFAPTLNVGSLPLVGALELGQATFAHGGISRAVRHALPSPKVAGVRVQNFKPSSRGSAPAAAGAGSCSTSICPPSTTARCAGASLSSTWSCCRRSTRRAATSSPAATGTCVSLTRRSHIRRRRRTSHGCPICRPG